MTGFSILIPSTMLLWRSSRKPSSLFPDIGVILIPTFYDLNFQHNKIGEKV